ncbi:response regulator [Candidatus Micrarchaeota archaeon]|nr:response regulator [Candidatus Micrarchaeota archaeon]
MAKIMVVDNEKAIVEMLRTMLGLEGHEVVPAYSGKECLQKLRRGKVDLVILDVMMPGMSGWDVFQRIREGDKKTPIMFLTVMFAPKGQIAAFMKEGLCAYVTKPFGRKELLNTVKRCIAK